MIRRSRITAGLLAFLVVLALPMVVGVAAAKSTDNNAGTIKVHDDMSADPDEKNQPHVSCDFWIEGFNMQDSSGALRFQAWPPTGNKTVVTPTGDGLNWTADSGNKHGNYHFLNGPYELPAGHYKVTAINEGGEKTKSKVFWVDDCVTPPTPPTEIPFFPSAASMALGVVGALGAVGVVLLRRR